MFTRKSFIIYYKTSNNWIYYAATHTNTYIYIFDFHETRWIRCFERKKAIYLFGESTFWGTKTVCWLCYSRNILKTNDTTNNALKPNLKEGLKVFINAMLKIGCVSWLCACVEHFLPRFILLNSFISYLFSIYYRYQNVFTYIYIYKKKLKPEPSRVRRV